MQFYPQGFSAGRKAWFGFGSSSTPKVLTIQNEISDGAIQFLSPTTYVSGNSGLGTATPKTKLTVVSHGSSNPDDLTDAISKSGILLSSSYQGSTVDNYLPGLFWANAYSGMSSEDKPKAGIWVKQNGGTDIIFGTSDDYANGINQNVVINQRGFMGIGTTSPQTNLHISGGSDPEIKITNTTNASYLRLMAVNSNGVNEAQIAYQDLLRFVTNGQVKAEINTTGIRACQFNAETLTGCDFVFENDYLLPSLKKRKEKVLPGKHLLNIAPAKVMVQEGIDLGQTMMGILQNVEEHELYFYNHDERIEFLEKENKELREIINALLKQNKVTQQNK